jgi:signal transduction histidine kinase/ActR/RegA family two-component response regulator
MLIENDDRYYTPKELYIFNMLKYPVWVFDIKRRGMYWGNETALKVWNAESLEALTRRDFASDMSQAAKTFLNDLLPKFERNETVTEQWTFYPEGKEAKTMGITCSGIRIDDGRMAMLVEAELPDKALDESAVRGIEFLRRLPFAVAHFSIDGSLVYQNPEAVDQYGIPEATDENPNPGDFLSRFVDKEVARKALEQVQEGTDFSAEAKQHTSAGPRWFSVSARRTKDPVTSKFVILFSARDISDIITARRETTRAAMKSEFMAVMAHEIRTPLHQMVGYLDLLESSNLNADQLDFLKQIQSSSSMLMSIINDLLDYSKLECGQVQVENVDFALEGLIDGSLASVQARADQKMLKLQSKLAGNLPSKLVGDPNRLRQILLNLLSNAVKFTDNGSITVTVSSIESTKDHERLRFEVTDTGIGIPSSAQDAVFEKYRQADASVARHFGGTGLGLAICKGLVELMGGIIGLKSELSKGTTMFFEIPFQRPSSTRENPLPEARNGTHHETRRMRILVVEDNKINQKVMRSMLERLGHAVTLAENGQVAVDEIQRQAQESFDLVLMDVQMPIMDGIECTKHIRSVLRIDKATLPVIGLTASFQRAELEYYEGLGMNDCLGKPLRLEQLKQALSCIACNSRCAT